MTHAGSRLFGRPRRARRTGAPSWPVRLYRAVRDAVRERIGGAWSVDRAGQTAPWTSSAAAAGLLLLGGAAVALSPIAVGELVTSSRDDVRPGAPSTSPAPVPLPAPPPEPAPEVAPTVAPTGPGPAGAPGAVVAPRRTVHAVVDDPPAEVTVHRTGARQDPSHHPEEDRDDADGADDREEDDTRESSGSTADDQDVQGESEQVIRDREKVEREREAIEAERERIEESR